MTIKLLRQISSVVSFHCLTIRLLEREKIVPPRGQLLGSQADKLTKRPSKATVKSKVHAWVECLPKIACSRSYG